MAASSIQSHVAAAASDPFTKRVEDVLAILLSGCQCAAQASDAPGKNATMKVNLQLLSDALDAWVAALDAQILTL
jgi:hypothetical protein